MFRKKKFFLYSGTSNGYKEKLTGFDAALVDAGISCYNLVKVSSIRPPFFSQVNSIDQPEGSILFTAFASLTGQGKGIISSAVAVGIPCDKSQLGVIMEYSCYNNKEVAEQKARDMVQTAMLLRVIPIISMVSISVESRLVEDSYSSTIAGVALW